MDLKFALKCCGWLPTSDIIDIDTHILFQTIDLSTAALAAKVSREKVVDFTQPYYFDRLGFMFKMAEKEGKVNVCLNFKCIDIFGFVCLENDIFVDNTKL